MSPNTNRRSPLQFARQSVLPAALAVATFALATDARAQVPDPAPRYRSLAFRIGPNFSPGTGLTIGLDYTPPNSGIGRGLETRITAEGGFVVRESGFLPEHAHGEITLDEVYQKPGAGRSPYVGAGLGIYSGPFVTSTSGGGLFGTLTTYDTVTRFGGKVFVGADFTSTTSAEAALHFAGGSSFGLLQLRLKL